jgi:dienelactone hydrolase
MNLFSSRIRPHFLILILLIAGLVRADQAPQPAAAPPAPAQAPAETEVKFPGYQGFELAGTLSIPAQVPPGGAAGVLLLPGSGPTDRNGNQPPYLVTDLLRQMAQRLAYDGFVVLRFDKRAAQGYASRWPADPALQNVFFAWEAFSGDARAAFEFLRGRPEVDRARTAIVGHSEGSLIALQVAGDLAAGSPPTALVLAGASGTRLDDVVRAQIASLLQRQGADEATRKQYLEALDKAIRSVVESETVPADLPAGLRPLFPANAMKLLHSYFTIDPLALARRYRGPVLLLHGAMDSQLPAEEHTAKLLATLAARPGGAQERAVIPNASHNLKPASSLTDFGFAGDVVPGALDALAGFLGRVLAKK